MKLSFSFSRRREKNCSDLEHQLSDSNWPPKCFLIGMLLLIVAIGVGVVTALVSLDWFFANAEETDRSMAEWERPFVPWWATKFGIWITLSSTAGGITYAALPHLFPKIFLPL